jgi:hypothetical protein
VHDVHQGEAREAKDDRNRKYEEEGQPSPDGQLVDIKHQLADTV